MAGETCFANGEPCAARRGSPHLCFGPNRHDGSHMCVACGAAWTRPLHAFAGMKRTADGRYYGSCACGHEETPAANKDHAWEEIASHAMNAPGGLRDMLRLATAQWN